MRTDFREERKWKFALAYNLSTAVLEWHAAGSLEERAAKGICVLWKRPRPAEDNAMDEDVREPPPENAMDIDDPSQPPSAPPEERSSSKSSSFLVADYGSDDDDDDEQEKDQQSVVDALEPSSLLDDALDAADERGGNDAVESGLKTLEFKTEDIEDPSALQPANESGNSMAMEVDGPQGETQPYESQSPSQEDKQTEDETPKGLKSSSTNPLLSLSKPSDVPPLKASFKSSISAPLREAIAYSDPDKLFLDLDDLIADRPFTATESEPLFHPSSDLSLSAIFPDLQPFGILEVLPPTTFEGKKKSDKKSDRDDPNKRAEDTTYTKLFPVGQFMSCKPTLLSTLQPARRWRNGKWVSIDDGLSVATSSEMDGGGLKVDDSASGKFCFQL